MKKLQQILNLPEYRTNMQINQKLTLNKPGLKDAGVFLKFANTMEPGKILILEENSEPFRTNGHPGNGVSSNELIIDKEAYIVYLHGSKITFPKKEFELLLLLASNPRKVFKRVEILIQIWGKEFRQKDSRSLDVHIRMLRRKLNDHFITTIRGVGYKLEK